MFYQRELPFLGHIVSAEGIKPDPEKVEAIRQLPPPRNKSELRTFLGMITYVKRFIPECSTLTAPLSALTGKDTNFDWTLHSRLQLPRPQGEAHDGPHTAVPPS